MIDNCMLHLCSGYSMMNENDSRNVMVAFQMAASAAEEVAIEDLKAAEHRRSPSFMYKPRLSIDGNQWCALYGENLMEGVAGFGDSPELAYSDFDKNWVKPLPNA